LEYIYLKLDKHEKIQPVRGRPLFEVAWKQKMKQRNVEYRTATIEIW